MFDPCCLPCDFLSPIYKSLHCFFGKKVCLVQYSFYIMILCRALMLYVCKLISCSIYFIAEVNCWQDWLIFSDAFFFLIKSGCIDFVDFVDKLVSRLQDGDNSILRTNHVTWLLAQIIRVELVMAALNSDARKVIYLFIF